jgi:mannose-6-phosphate isomerase-like protein (cupin superfamily)
MERQRVREMEPRPSTDQHYDMMLQRRAKEQARADTCRVVVKSKELPWIQSRMGYVKRFLNWQVEDTALVGWTHFIHEIHRHSGKHCHQGGLVLYVLEGKGYTTCDGVKVDWEAGDLILLPIKPGGVEHQHFNADPGTPCRWLAFIYTPYSEAMGSLFRHVEDSPEYTR